MEQNQKTDYIGNIIVFILLGLLIYAGFISYKSINWNILKDLESKPLILPTPIPTVTISTQSAEIPATSAAIATSTPKKISK
jgi:hypothetical protein